MVPPVVTIGSTTATTIQLNWTIPGPVVDSYEVTWKRNTSGKCPNDHMGNAYIIDRSTSYTIRRMEEDSSYTITVTATNAAGSADSDPITGITEEASESLFCLLAK